MADALQHLVVALVALAAAGLILRRVAEAVRPGAAGECASCPTRHTERRREAAPREDEGGTHPMVFVKRHEV